jgi:hypothetical protein
MIFVFGSNMAGRHGKYAALEARYFYGAKLGIGVGRTGNSYAIPTKDEDLRTLPLDIIKKHVDDFLFYAESNPDLKFFVTKVGCGLAGYSSVDIAPFFKGAPSNCQLPEEWVWVNEN